MPNHEETQQIIEYRATPWVDLRKHLRGLELVHSSLGPFDNLYLLAKRPTRQRNRVFHNRQKDTPIYDYTVLKVNEQSVQRFEFPDRDENFRFVQPLPNNELLLVNTHPPDFSGKVFSNNGTLIREFPLGFGIEDVQTTSDGCIWTSYIDEAVLGTEIGQHGLVLWNKSGQKTYEYPEHLPSIIDCYALNVVSDSEIWCYYFRDFPLVRIRDLSNYTLWYPEISGSHGFLVWENYVLFLGRYRQEGLFSLFELRDNEKAVLSRNYRIKPEIDGYVPNVAAWRGHMLYYLDKKHFCFRVDLRELLLEES